MSTPLKLIDDHSGKIELYPDWCLESGRLFENLKRADIWRGRRISLFGRTSCIPRLEAWTGEVGIQYGYSGAVYKSSGWLAHIQKHVDRIETEFSWLANGALLNYYRSGQDSMGWHSDNEPELGADPKLAILSLGGARDIIFRKIEDKTQKIAIRLDSGSLLLMNEGVQKYWQHSIPKRTRAQQRISVTFRQIVQMPAAISSASR